jgi:hypothetical protein
MTGLLIILALFVVPYVAFNIRRVRRGRRWAFSVCQVAKEWEQREHEKHVARRAASLKPRKTV